MTKIVKFVALVVAVILGFSGCSVDDGYINYDTNSSEDVEVERGPIMDALVRDANGQGATVKNRNIYTFADPITYPVTVSGGWIDVNGNGIREAGDVDFDMVMKSYISVITPLTTMAANDDDVNASNFEHKLQLIADMFGISLADAKKLPSQSLEVAFIASAIFNDTVEMGDLDTSNLEDINTTLAEVREFCNFESAVEVEECVISWLGLEGPSEEEMYASNNNPEITLNPETITFTNGQHGYSEGMMFKGDVEDPIYGSFITLRYSSDLNVTGIDTGSEYNIDSEQMVTKAKGDMNYVFTVHSIDTEAKTITLYSNQHNNPGYYNIELDFYINGYGLKKDIDPSYSYRVSKYVPVKINPLTDYVGVHIQMYNGDYHEAIELDSDGTGTYKNNKSNNVKYAVSYEINGNEVTITKDINQSDTITYIFPDELNINSSVEVNNNGDEYSATIGAVNSDKEAMPGNPMYFAENVSGYEMTFKYLNDEGNSVLGVFYFDQIDSDSDETNYTTSGRFTLEETLIDGTPYRDVDGIYETDNEVLTYMISPDESYDLTFTTKVNWSVNETFNLIQDGSVAKTTKLVKITQGMP